MSFSAAKIYYQHGHSRTVATFCFRRSHAFIQLFVPTYSYTLRHRRARYLSVLFRLLRVKVRLRQKLRRTTSSVQTKALHFRRFFSERKRNRIRKPVRRWTERAILSYELHLKNFRNSSSEIFLSPLVSTAFMNSYNATATVNKLLQ